MVILGVDCSTTTIGLCLLDESGNCLSMRFIKPEGEDLFAKVLDSYGKIHTFIKDLPVGLQSVSHVVVERPIRFANRGSNAQTISVLNWFNGAIWTVLYDLTGLHPVDIPPETARKLTIGIGRYPKGTDTKLAVFNWVCANIKLADSSFQWPINKRHTPAVERFDMADSYIVALARLKQLQNEEMRAKQLLPKAGKKPDVKAVTKFK